MAISKESLFKFATTILQENSKTYIVVACDENGNSVKAAKGDGEELLSCMALVMFEMADEMNIPLDKLLDIFKEGALDAYKIYLAKKDAEKVRELRRR